MGHAAYNRGSLAISQQIDQELAEKRKKRYRCYGKFYNGPDKRYVRCDRCHHIDWEANEGDICQRWIEKEKP